MTNLAIDENRKMQNYTKKEMVLRVLWGIFYSTLFRLSPRPLFGFRVYLLRLFGAKIGKNVHLYSSIQVTLPWKLEIGDFSSVGERAIIYNLGFIRLGSSVTISQGAHLCGGTHDFRNRKMPLIKSDIKIEDGAWICADAFVGPGVSVEKDAVVAARAVVVKNVKEREIVGGNPAKKIGERVFHDES